MQFAGTLPRSAAWKLVRKPTWLSFCKAASQSGNSNDEEFGRLESVVANVCLTRERSGACDSICGRRDELYELRGQKQKYRQIRTGCDLGREDDGGSVDFGVELCAGLGHQP